MGVRFIDDALKKKIQKWVKDPNMKVLGVQDTLQLFQITADEKNDKPLTLPFISISRDSSIDILSTNKKPLSFDGKLIEGNLESRKVKQLDAIPISVNYQIDIYTKKYIEGDEYVRNFIFNIINYPKMSVEIPYNDTNIVHTANIRMIGTVTDTSDVPQRLYKGQFTRWTIKLIVDDCYLFSVPIKDTLAMEDPEYEIVNEIK